MLTVAIPIDIGGMLSKVMESEVTDTGMADQVPESTKGGVASLILSDTREEWL